MFSSKHTPGVQHVFIKIFHTAVRGFSAERPDAQPPAGPPLYQSEPLGGPLPATCLPSPWLLVGSVPCCRCFHRPPITGSVTLRRPLSLSEPPFRLLEDGDSSTCFLAAVKAKGTNTCKAPHQVPRGRGLSVSVTVMNNIIDRASHRLGEVGPEDRLGGAGGVVAPSCSQRSPECLLPSVLGPVKQVSAGVASDGLAGLCQERLGEGPPEIFGPQDRPPSPKVAPAFQMPGPR